MTLNQLVCKAASAYPEALVMAYWDMRKSEPRENRQGGDTLAQFIAREPHETYDAEATETEQVASAVKAMQTAADDLQKVVVALRGLTARQAA